MFVFFVFLAAVLGGFAAGFILGTAHGVRSEYETWHEGMVRMERLRREGRLT